MTVSTQAMEPRFVTFSNLSFLWVWEETISRKSRSENVNWAASPSQQHSLTWGSIGPDLTSLGAQDIWLESSQSWLLPELHGSSQRTLITSLRRGASLSPGRSSCPSQGVCSCPASHKHSWSLCTPLMEMLLTPPTPTPNQVSLLAFRVFVTSIQTDFK